MQITQCFGGLISLDASFNEICERKSITDDLPALNELKLTNLVGNPVTLLEFYRDECLYYNKTITNLDDIPIPVLILHILESFKEKEEERTGRKAFA